MKNLHLKLTLNSLRVNKKIYIPYLIICTLMIAIVHILNYLQTDFIRENLSRGQDQIMVILVLGTAIIGIFSVLFLVYTNSFISKRRTKEYGVYNLIGFSKKNLCVNKFYETIILFLISIVAGNILGLIMSKASELIFAKIINVESNFNLNISLSPIFVTLVMFGFIFLFTMLLNFRKIKKTNPLELVKDQKMGQKTSPFIYVMGVIGLILLFIAYLISASTLLAEPSVEIIQVFGFDCLLVIVATYMVFICASVVICKSLQKKKKYYYKKKHFTSLSMLCFRMKNNGAGLASISIFLIMIFVSTITTISLYSNINQAVNEICAKDMNIVMQASQNNAKAFDIFDNQVDTYVSNKNLKKENNIVFDYHYVFARLNDNTIIADGITSKNAYTLNFMPVENANEVFGLNLSTDTNNILFVQKFDDKNIEKLNFNGNTYNLDHVVNPPANLTENISAQNINNSAFMLYNSENSELIKALQNPNIFMRHINNFDLNISNNEKIEFGTGLQNLFTSILKNPIDPSITSSMIANSTCKAEATELLYDLYGSLVFIGILLSIVFLISAVIIIYYKQISEAQEDMSKFLIMKKAGMSIKDIKKSVNSQMRTVFLMPLIFAIVTTLFAIPSVYSLLSLMWTTQSSTMITIIVSSLIVGTIFYLVIFKLTSKSYLSIVSKSESVHI